MMEKISPSEINYSVLRSISSTGEMIQGKEPDIGVLWALSRVAGEEE